MTPLPQSLLYRKLVEQGLVPSFSAVDRPKRKRNNEEWRIQSAAFRWWRASAAGLGVWHKLYFAIPNGGALGQGKEDWEVTGRMIRGKMLKLAGLETGVPDTFLALPSPAKDSIYNHRGMFIEYKTAQGELSDEQAEFFLHARVAGYRCEVSRSVEDTAVIMKAYLST